jgi:hypothetical protein
MFNSSINWEKGTPKYTNNLPTWSRVAYGNGIFVAIEGSGDSVMYSSDGSIWEYGNNIIGLGQPESFWNGASSEFRLNGCLSVAFGNGRFVASSTSGKVFYSTDGKNWIVVSNPPAIKDVAFGGGRFVSFWNYGGNSASLFYYSSDGITWTQAASSPTFGRIRQLSNIGSAFIGGAVRVSDNRRLFVYSTNGGISWSAAFMPVLTGMEYYEQSAAGNCIVSNNGFRQDCWVFLVSNGNSPTNKCAFARGTFGAFALQTLPSSRLWCSIAFGNERFVILAHGSNIALLGQINRSTANIVWTEVNLPFILTSRNGIAPVFPGVVWGNNRFVIVDPSMKSAHSSDGINWTESQSLRSVSNLSLNSIYPFSLANILNVPSEFI